MAAKAKVADPNLSGGGTVGADEVRHVTVLQQDVIIECLYCKCGLVTHVALANGLIARSECASVR